MGEKSPAYLWYPKDVISSGKVSELTASEECWYRRALDHSWLDEGIPADPGKASKRIGKGCTTKAAKIILEMFFVADRKDPAKMRNIKQEILRKELRQKTAKRIEAGRLSGVKRREQRDLTIEQCSNYEAAKTNIPIAIAIPKKDEEEEPATQAETAKPEPVARRIWTDGVQLLTESGLTNYNARSLLGKLGKEYTQPLLAECIAVTMAANPVNSEEFLIGTLKNRKQNGKHILDSNKSSSEAADRLRANTQII